jgi:hypothetical protein
VWRGQVRAVGYIVVKAQRVRQVLLLLLLLLQVVVLVLLLPF